MKIEYFIAGIISVFIPALIGMTFSSLANAQEDNLSQVVLTATVPENEINHCVKVLQDAGYIK